MRNGLEAILTTIPYFFAKKQQQLLGGWGGREEAQFSKFNGQKVLNLSSSLFSCFISHAMK